MQEISSSSFSPHLDEQSYLICDTKGIIRYASRGFQDLYGYDSSECIGQTYNNLVGCGSLLGTEAGNALKEEAAKAGLQFSEAISAVQTMMSDMDEAAQKIFKAPLGTVIPMAAGPCLMANRRRNCELFVCEVVLKRSLHPTLGWSYNVTIQRDVSGFISVSELLKASSRGMLHFNTFCRNVGPPSSGDEPLTDDHLNAVAQHMWTSNLIMDMSKKKDGKKSTSTKAPSLASVSTTCSSRKSTSSIQSAASSASHSPTFHHLGAIIGLAQTKQSEVMEKVAEEVEVAPEESPVPRFWDILEGPDEERVEEADTWDAFGPEESPVKWEMPFVDFKELVEHVSREDLCELSLPLVIADPSKAHFPIILCSTGFEQLTGLSAEEAIGFDIRTVIGSVPESTSGLDLSTKWRLFCAAAKSGKLYAGRDGFGEAFMSPNEPSLRLPKGEFAFIQVSVTRDGEPFKSMVYLKQVELDDLMLVIAIQSRMPDDAVGKHQVASERCSKFFADLNDQLDEAIQILAAEFFYSASMRRQSNDNWTERCGSSKKLPLVARAQCCVGGVF